MNILIVDDHHLVRAGFKLILSRMPDVNVIGEAGDGREAVKMVQRHKPDVVLLDITMPGLGGLEALEKIHVIEPQIRVIMLSMHGNEEFVAKSIRSGASAYLLKEAATTELITALETVAMNQTYLSQGISRELVDKYLYGTSSTDVPLTTRQREILQLIGEGKSTRQMADEMHLSVKTIEAHRTKLMNRLDIHDIAGLVRYAIRKGLISLDA